MYLQSIMSNYLNENKKEFSIENNSNPIKPKNSNWITSEKCMKKTYEFKEIRRLERFIVEIIKYNRETEADIEFRVRQKKVGILIHSLSPYISEIETEASVDIDKIKKDVMYYYADP